MNTCSICKHKQRAGIEAALVRGESFRHIESQFSVGYKSVQRHQECISDSLREARKQRERRRRYLCRGCGHRFTKWARFTEATRGDKDLARIKELLIDIQGRLAKL